MADLSCHVSVLSPGRTPHKPHKHREEELLILLSGEVELLVPGNGPNREQKSHRIKPGAFIYYPAGQRHTLRNSGTGPATYFMFKWFGRAAEGSTEQLPAALYHLDDLFANCRSAEGSDFIANPVFQGATRYLDKLHGRWVILPPRNETFFNAGTGETGVLVLRGDIQVRGQDLSKDSVIFLSAGEGSTIKNAGRRPAVCLVFEFHGLAKGWFFTLAWKKLRGYAAGVKKSCSIGAF